LCDRSRDRFLDRAQPLLAAAVEPERRRVCWSRLRRDFADVVTAKARGDPVPTLGAGQQRDGRTVVRATIAMSLSRRAWPPPTPWSTALPVSGLCQIYRNEGPDRALRRIPTVAEV
jgi:hypothetical protein